jgi:type IV secretory pathway TrbF-like protein
VVKDDSAAELRVVVTAIHAVAADAVLVAKHLLKVCAHLVTALARLHVHNLARRRRLEAGGMRKKKGGEEQRNVRNSVWQFGTGNWKCRWHARMYPGRENKLILPPLPLEIWAP